MAGNGPESSRQRVRFVWDPQKNRANVQKHGLHFSDAASVLAGPILLTLDERHDYSEERWVGLGLLNGHVVSIVFTEPDVDIVCVISLRKATSDERARFHQDL